MSKNESATPINLWASEKKVTSPVKEDKPQAENPTTTAPASKRTARQRKNRNQKKDDKAPAEKSKSKDRAPPTKPTFVPKQRRHNVVIVRQNVTFKTLVIQTKTLLKNQFDTIELHGVDEKSYVTVSNIARCLSKNGYVTLTRLKTKTVQVVDIEDESKTLNPHAKLQPRLIIHLTKTAEFDSIYDDFEAKFKKMLEEHSEDIKEAENAAEGDEVAA